jgi:hypothetical protein
MSSASQSQFFSRKSNIRWMSEDIHKICDWFIFRDEAEIIVNAKFYNVINKTIATRKILKDTKLIKIKSKTTDLKIKNKVIVMIDNYKKIKIKTNQTRWELNESNPLINEYASEKNIIRETLKSMCSCFFEFETVFDDHSNVQSSFLSESDQSDAQISESKSTTHDNDSNANVSSAILNQQNKRWFHILIFHSFSSIVRRKRNDDYLWISISINFSS